LQQGWATKQDLLKDIYAAEDTSEAPAAMAKRFEHDKRRLHQRLGVQVRYDKRVGGYILADWERPLLNLPDAEIETLAFLADTFQPDSPHAADVQRLIDTLVGWLSPERQEAYRRASGQLPDVELRLRDSAEIAPDVWETVLEAYNAKQQLAFDYLSSQHDDGIPRQHVVEPWYFYFSDRGHWRLRAYCLFNDGPHGPWHPNDYINYRVSRIAPDTAKILPTKLPPTPRLARPRRVIYELAPQIARFGVSHRPELLGAPKTMEMDEGWVRVEGETHDVFQLARNLLYYGANCRVLGGRELLREMRGLVEGLAEIYR
jgi:predicted DNA-binding transcriptional regulator YafY